MAGETKLTDKQKIFCKEYIIDFNGSRAARAAGYSVKTCDRIASENLGKLEIKEELARLTKSRNEKLEVSAARVVEELAKMGLTDKTTLGEFVLDSSHKLKALEMLARHTGTFNADESGKAVIKVSIKKPE